MRFSKKVMAICHVISKEFDNMEDCCVHGVAKNAYECYFGNKCKDCPFGSDENYEAFKKQMEVK